MDSKHDVWLCRQKETTTKKKLIQGVLSINRVCARKEREGSYREHHSVATTLQQCSRRREKGKGCTWRSPTHQIPMNRGKWGGRRSFSGKKKATVRNNKSSVTVGLATLTRGIEPGYRKYRVGKQPGEEKSRHQRNSIRIRREKRLENVTTTAQGERREKTAREKLEVAVKIASSGGGVGTKEKPCDR